MKFVKFLKSLVSQLTYVRVEKRKKKSKRVRARKHADGSLNARIVG